MSDIRVFGLGSSVDFSRRVERGIREVTDDPNFSLSPIEESTHDDGEPYFRALENIRGSDVYIIQSLYGDVRCLQNEGSISIVGESPNDKFVKMLMFADSLKDASADKITAVIPYLAYSRQDRKVKSREPIYTKYIAKYIESAGIDRVLTMDVHNLAAFQNAFRIQTDNLEAKNLIVDWVVENVPDRDFVILAPDAGGMGRAKRFRNALVNRLKRDIDVVYVDKSRIDGVAKGEKIIGDIKDKYAIILDDMIGSGKTVAISQRAVESGGGKVWAVCATHGLFVGDANKHLAGIDRLVVTDTIYSDFRLSEKLKNSLTTISTAKLFAQAIRRTHVGASISDLLK